MASTARMSRIAREYSWASLMVIGAVTVVILLLAALIFLAFMTPAHAGEITVVFGSGRCYLPPPPIFAPSYGGAPAFVPDCAPPWAQPYGGGYAPPPWTQQFGGLPYGPPDRYSSSTSCNRGRCTMDETATWDIPGGRVRMNRTIPVAPPWARRW